MTGSCEKCGDAAARSLLSLIREDERRAREAGLTYDNVREALRDLADEEITFARLVEILRATARVMAEDGRL